jgi:hypothetical protein
MKVSTPWPTLLVCLLSLSGCDLPSSSDDSDGLSVCPFGWCRGLSAGESADGDTGSWDTGDGDSVNQSNFLDAFSANYCQATDECWCGDGDCDDGYYSDCRSDVISYGESCSGYQSQQAAWCLDEIEDLDECWELDEGDWISPCQDVYNDDDCSRWWTNGNNGAAQ